MTPDVSANPAPWIEDPPTDAVASRVLYRGDAATITAFSVPAGCQISKHVNSNLAMAFILRGQADVMIGGEHHAVPEGSLVRFPPGVEHALDAGDDGFDMLLTVVKGAS